MTGRRCADCGTKFGELHLDDSGDTLCRGCHVRRPGPRVDERTVEEEAEPARKLVFRSATEVRASAPEEPDFVLDGYFFRGAVTAVGGKPKAGKSTLVLAAVEAIATGAPTFLGRGIRGGPVVYVSEEGAGTLRSKLPTSDRIRVLTREDAWPKPTWTDLVLAAVTEARRVDAVLLVIDTFAYWAALGADQEKDAGAVGGALNALVEAALAGLAVVLVHHHRKGGGENGDALRGSTALPGVVEVIMDIERLPDPDAPPAHRQILGLGRYPERTPAALVVDRDPATCAWRVIGEADGRSDAERVSWREKLLGALPATEPGATREDIERLLGADCRKWRGDLGALAKDGSVLVTGAGKKGNPERFRTAPADSAPEFRPEPGAECGEPGLDLFRPLPPVVPVGDGGKGRNEPGEESNAVLEARGGIQPFDAIDPDTLARLQRIAEEADS